MHPNIMLLLSTILWGFWGFADRMAVSRVSAYTVQWMLSLPYVASIPLLYYLSTRQGGAYGLDMVAFGWAGAGSVASIVASVLLLMAMQKTPASTAVAVTAAYPVFTLILAVVARVESFSIQKLLGVLIVVIGVDRKSVV